jgi:hypothetical protein
MTRAKYFKPVVAMTLCFLIAGISLVGSVTAQPQKPNILFLVKKLYIGSIEDTDKQNRDITGTLKQELISRGFLVVNERADADATLSGWFGTDLPLDDADPDSMKTTYEFHLSSSNNEEIWKCTIRIHHSNEPRNGARKVATKLGNDWKQSAKRAALKPGN